MLRCRKGIPMEITADNITELLHRGHVLRRTQKGTWHFRNYLATPRVWSDGLCTEGWEPLAFGRGAFLSTCGGMLAQYMLTTPGTYVYVVPENPIAPDSWAILQKVA